MLLLCCQLGLEEKEENTATIPLLALHRNTEGQSSATALQKV